MYTQHAWLVKDRNSKTLFLSLSHSRTAYGPHLCAHTHTLRRSTLEVKKHKPKTWQPPAASGFFFHYLMYRKKPTDGERASKNPWRQSERHMPQGASWRLETFAGFMCSWFWHAKTTHSLCEMRSAALKSSCSTFFPVLSVAVGVELAEKQEKGKNECGDDDVWLGQK